MPGIVFYGAMALGLGLLIPLGKAEGPHSIGLRFVAGAAFLLLGLYAAMVLLALPLRLSVLIIGALSAAGWVRAFLGQTAIDAHEAVLHPALVLPVVAAVVASVYGRIDYIPYLVDEFTNWIGVSRVIHWAGSYEAVRETVYLPGYTPGWRLLLLAPWQVTGEIDHGLSAAAPFVLHVAVLALLYDITVIMIAPRDGKLPPATSRGVAWLALLVFLAAEGMGRLWTFEMLVEQPQIYMLSAATLLILRAELSPPALQPLYTLAGVVLAAGYLLKAAVLAAVPAAMLLAALPLVTSETPFTNRLREGVIRALLLLLPLTLVMLSWSAVAPSNTCLSSPISVFTTGKEATYDAVDLARRFGAAVGTYVLQYKQPVTLAAVAGLALGIHLRLWRAALFATAFTAIYFASLYWYHLGCFGEYYYRELNSIPRFSRVPLQMLHALGLLLLATGIAHFAGTRWPSIGAKRGTVLACIALAVGLATWHVRQTYRTVTDLTTRAYQNVDPRVGEMRQAAAFAERHGGRLLPEHSAFAVLSQGQDGDVQRYAEYFSRRPGNGGFSSLFTVHYGSSWAPIPANAWQTAIAPGALAKELGSLDILWPTHVDEWLVGGLRGLVPDEACLQRLPNSVLIRDREAPMPRFSCMGKND